MEEFPSTNPNPVFRIGKEGKILYSNRAGELLLREWDLNRGEYLPLSFRNLVQKVFSKKSPGKEEIKIGKRIYLFSIHPFSKEAYANLYGFEISGQKELEEKLRKKEKQYDVLHKIGRMGLTYESLQAFMDKSVRLVAQTLELEYCKILKLLPSGNFLLKAGVGWKPGYVGKYIVEGQKNSQAGYTLLSKTPVLVEDLMIEKRFCAPPILLEHGVFSGMSVLIGSVEKPYGVLGAHSTKKRKFSEEDAYFLSSVAFLIAGVIKHRRMEEKLIQYREHLEELVKARTSELTRTNKQLSLEIAGRKKMEKELQNNVIFLETFLDAMPSPAFYRNLESVYQICNEMFASFILGRSKAEVIGKSMYDFKKEFPEAMLRTTEYYDRLLLKAGKSQPHEVRISCAGDGKLRDFLVHKARFKSVSGEVIGIVGVLLDITERKKAERALLEAENLRKKEIHHRIKNNLQVISSLLSLQAEQFRDEKVIEAFEDSQHRVISMSLIHEELYKTEDAESLDFTAYLQKLTQELLKSYNIGDKAIQLKLELENVFLEMDTAIPLGIIINELVSNSLKHAFSEKKSGEIKVKLCREKNESSGIVLIVSDNGKGLEAEIDFRKTSSLGLQLVTTLVDQIEGKIELEKDPGTKFIISFRERKEKSQMKK
ncbi:MAG: histidine kinase dimerization/phosphoacceptor domain -containing protein [Methanosarcinaceae archaeon]|nr:histidine kinase dimerization/phosphoacceptor domain -containing protein [Methanosarcinaceae archaeon]MDD4749563.1 histidine kinase dimerization/phosphoacceptor domain -containing protein [Methanosarcinaceae archaeon]